MPKAIEVVTLLGDSVVDVSYRTKPQPQRARRIFAGVALVCLLGASAAFAGSVATAAQNDDAFDRWTAARRPAYAFRPVRDSWLLDIVALGGLALGVCAFTGMWLCRRREDDGLTLAGETVTFDELAALDGRIDAGPASYIVRAVEVPEQTPLRPLRSELRPVFYGVGSLAVHLGLLWLMSRAPVEGDPASISFVGVDPVAVEVVSTAVEQAPLDALEHDEVALAGPSMVLENLSSYTLSNAHVRMVPARRDPLAERALAIAAARNAGLLGSGILHPNFFSTLHTDASLGFDDRDVTCGPLCNEPGPFGFGFGRSGFGVCGGDGFHTIGTGRYHTLGYSNGGRPWRTREQRKRVSDVPTVHMGQPVTQGDSDKAIIRRYIKRNLGKVTYCYERQLLVTPGLAGSINVQFLIGTNGIVQTAVAHGIDESVASCIEDVILAIEFPRPRGGVPVQVNYPFTVRLAGQ